MIGMYNVIVIVIVISSATQKLSAPGHQLIHERCDESKGGFQRGVTRSSGPISRLPGGDSVAVRVGVVEMGRGNDEKVMAQILPKHICSSLQEHNHKLVPKILVVQQYNNHS